MQKIQNNKRYTILLIATAISFLSGLLYIWSIVSKGLISQYHWTSTQASLPYTVATVSFVLSMAAAGKLQDVKGPRVCLTLASFLIGGGLILSGLTTEPVIIMITFGVITGAGLGITNVATTPPALKWFPPDKKGMVTGIVVAGIALASVVYSPVMDQLIKLYGVSAAFIILGVVIFILLIILAQFMSNPPKDYVFKPAEKRNDGTEKEINYNWKDMLKMPLPYKLWVMLAFTSAAGLMIIGHAANIAKVQVNWDGGFILVILIAVFNAIGRICGGIVSDKIGRIALLRLAFIALAANMALFALYKSIALLCVGAAVTGICYGAIFAVFPATTADFFGLKHFGANYGLIFTAWGLGGIIGPITAAGIYDATKSFNMAYLVSCAIIILAIILAFTIKQKGRRE